MDLDNLVLQYHLIKTLRGWDKENFEENLRCGNSALKISQFLMAFSSNWWIAQSSHEVRDFSQGISMQTAGSHSTRRASCNITVLPHQILPIAGNALPRTTPHERTTWRGHSQMAFNGNPSHNPTFFSEPLPSSRRRMSKMKTLVSIPFSKHRFYPVSCPPLIVTSMIRILNKM